MTGIFLFAFIAFLAFMIINVRNNNLLRDGGQLEGLKRTYYMNGKVKCEVNFENGNVIDGYKYPADGKITKMTPDELNNFMRDMQKPTGLIC